MSGRRRLVQGLVVAAACVAATAGLAAPAQAEVNNGPGALVVYDNNIENMAPCGGNDWTKLIAYMKRQRYSPDVFTVQQVSGSAQLATLVNRMTTELPGDYAGEIARERPRSMGYTSGCAIYKDRQTNAVVYRTDRFTIRESRTWRSDALRGGRCSNLEWGYEGFSQDRAENIGVRLHDRRAGRDVSVASIHWPTGRQDGPECADENMEEANTALDNLGGSLKIMGGDANTTVGTRGWWNDARGYGFRDAVADTYCPSECPAAHKTIAGKRIDFLLAKSSAGVSTVRTISAAMAGGAYSDHRAISAYVRY